VRRFRAWVAAGTTVLAAAALTIVPLTAGTAPASAAPELPVCPDPGAPSETAQPLGTDSNVSVFVGGSYTVGAAAAESEGILAVGGTATFDKSSGGVFNVGVVGLGSQIVPPPGSDMLLARGDSTVGTSTTVDVGHGIGGNVVAGGTAAPVDRYETSGGTVLSGATNPLGRFSDYGTVITERSAQYAAFAATGTVSEQYGTLTFAGDGSSDTQVFTIPGNELGSADSPRAIRFADVPTGARIIVNVTGATADVYPAGFFTDASSAQIGFSDPRFVELATHTMWNFPDATNVTIGTGDQLLGSVMVPRADSSTKITASTNGRLLIGGDLLFDGDGNEAHSYPFPDDDFECKPPVDPPVATGVLAIRKVVVDPAGVVDQTRTYSGTWTCTAPTRGVVPGGTWTARAGQPPTTLSANVPIGSTCSVTESSPPPPDPTDPSYVWDAPVIDPASVTIGADAEATITVTNTVERRTGSFSIRKVVTDPTGTVDPARTYSGTVACDIDGEDVTPADDTWSVRADGTATTVGPIPIGAVCRVDEDPLTPPSDDPDAVWDPPTITPSTVTIGSGTTPTVTVQNTVSREAGSFVIAKRFSGDDAGYVHDGAFRFTWTCTTPGGATPSGSLVVGADEIRPVDDVPAGSTCTVTEADDPATTDPSYEWQPPRIEVDGVAQSTDGRSATFTIPATGTRVVQVGFADELVRHTGAFAIEKHVVDPDGVANPNVLYHGTWSCTLAGSVIADGTWDLAGDAGERSLAIELPYGTVCNATEDLPVTSPAENGSIAYAWGAETQDTNTVVIGEDDEPLSVIHITNTVDDVLSSATIEKTVDDTTGDADPSARYTGTVTCTPPNGGASTTQRWAVEAGQPPVRLADGLLDGTTCAVTEDTPAPPAGDTWAAPVVSPNVFVVHAGVQVHVTVRNTLEPGETVDPTDPPTNPGDPGDPSVPPTDPGGQTGSGGNGGDHADGSLAWTGSDPWLAAAAGGVLLLAGLGVAVGRTRRRRH
jgi:choice-of-anchor A domain-containing protein